MFKIWRGGNEAESKEVARVNAWAQLDWFLVSMLSLSLLSLFSSHSPSSQCLFEEKNRPPQNKGGY